MNKRVNINTNRWESYTNLEELRDWVTGLIDDVPEDMLLKDVTVEFDPMDEYESYTVEVECFYSVPLSPKEIADYREKQVDRDKSRIIYHKEQIKALEAK